MENIIKHRDGVVVINGGDPLDGCPKNWDEAKDIIAQLNDGKHEDEPQWAFDCGFKLDYDGGLIRISSRFYPPKTHYGPGWDGRVAVIVLNQEIEEREFNCANIFQLKNDVEEYVKSVVKRIIKAFS